MFPIPSRHAVLCFVAGTLLALLALATRNAPLAVLAGGVFIGLGLAFAGSVSLGARLRRDRLEFSWWHTHRQADALGGAALRGVPFQVRCMLRNQGPRPVELQAPRPVLSEALSLVVPPPDALWLPERSRGEFELTLRADAAGRAVLHGLAVSVPGPLGLFLAPLYFAIPLTLKVLPRAATRGRARGPQGGSLPVERSGAASLRRPGSGTELRELRELRPGDPFKTIAWKTSAKLGRLVVREVEREVQQSLFVVLDVGGAMRAGAPGARMLDHALEIAALAARSAVERGERVGFLAFDGRTLVHVAQGEGLRHMIRLYDALLQLTELVDEDCTELDDAAVVERVGGYLRLQEALELPRPGQASLEPLLRHARRALQAETHPHEVQASSPELALLRRFCRLRGIDLGYRAERPGAERSAAFAQALLTVGAGTRMPRTLLVLSDLDGVALDAHLERPLRLLHAHHHALRFLLLDPTSYAVAPQPGLASDLHRVFGLQAERRLRDARRWLGRMGLASLAVRAADAPALVVQRSELAQRAA
jgi:uncharacterized protein (DUF58 family)